MTITAILISVTFSLLGLIAKDDLAPVFNQ